MTEVLRTGGCDTHAAANRRDVPPGNGASAGDWRITAPPVATLTVESDEAATTPTMSAAPVPSPSIGPV